MIAAVRHYLCLNCGGVSPAGDFEQLRWDESGSLMPILDTASFEDPVLRCPVCRWENEDTDGNPGLFDGSLAECRAERARELFDCAALWADVREELGLPVLSCLVGGR